MNHEPPKHLDSCLHYIGLFLIVFLAVLFGLFLIEYWNGVMNG